MTSARPGPVVLALPEGVMVVVVVVSFRGDEGVVCTEIQPDSKVDATITALSLVSMDVGTSVCKFFML